MMRGQAPPPKYFFPRTATGSVYRLGLGLFEVHRRVTLLTKGFMKRERQAADTAQAQNIVCRECRQMIN